MKEARTFSGFFSFYWSVGSPKSFFYLASCMTKKIYYTLTDESPFLATQSLLPIVQAYAKTADIDVETKNISLPARILAVFADKLPAGAVFFGKPVTDDLAFLESVPGRQAIIDLHVRAIIRYLSL